MQFLKSLIYNKRLLKKYKRYLYKGKYVLMPNMRTYCLAEQKSVYDFFPQDGLRKNGLKYKVIAWLFSFNNRKADDGNLKGVVAYFTNCPIFRNRDIKIFDYENKRVGIFCQNDVRYNLHNGIIEKTSEFPTVKTIENNREKLFFIEELFEKKQNFYVGYNPEFLNVFKLVVNWYKGYYSDADKNKTKIIDGIPYCLQHGDLSVDNILCSGSTFVLLDFDFIGDYPLYYDLWFFAVNFAFVFNDFSAVDFLIECFLAKEDIDNDHRLKFNTISRRCIDTIKSKRVSGVVNAGDADKYDGIFKYCTDKIREIEN